MLLITGTLKFILFIKIYSSFQELILILQDCIRKVIPFTFLIYFWVLMIACMFRILGADNGDEEELQAKYKLFGPFFYYTMNTYRQAIGDP